MHDGKGAEVKLALDTRGRKGKSVTLVIGLRHNPATLGEIGKLLRQQCGAGGTVKEGIILIQGDHRARIAGILRSMNYSVRE